MRDTPPGATIHPHSRGLQKAFLKSLCDREPLERTLVIAPTRTLLDHLGVRLAAERGAALGIDWMHHRQLAATIVEAAGESPPDELSRPWLHELLSQTLAGAEQGGNDLAGYLRRFPTAISALLSTFQDLRDAGVTDREDSPRGLSRTASETLQLFDAYQQQLRGLGGHRLGDTAAAAIRAREVLRQRPALPFQRVHHHGAYDLIGVHLELLRELARILPLHLWIPGAEESSSSAPSGKMARALGARTTGLPAGERSAARISLVKAFQPASEARRGLRQILAWHQRDGVPFDDMALLMRRAGPYRWTLRAELERLGLDVPLSSSGREHPRTAATLGFLALLEDSGSRRRRERLTRLAPESEAALRRHRWLERWRALRRPEAAFRILLEWSQSFGTEEIEAEIQLLEAIHTRLAAIPGCAALTPHTPAALLQRSLREAATEPDLDSTPLRILEVTKARAIPWRRAVVLGFNEGQFPSLPQEDPFLPDLDRERLRDAWQRPIHSKRDAAVDERFLFQLLRDSVDEELQLSYLASDLQGRTLSPSPYLRDLGPLPLERLPPHPQKELQALHESTSILSPAEAFTLQALGTRAADPSLRAYARKIGYRHPLLEGGLSMMERIEDFELQETGHDGESPRRPRESWSVSQLSRLGDCPLRYFFQYELGVDEGEEDEEGEYSRRDLGEVVHQVLEEVGRESLARGPGGVEIEPLRQRIAELWTRCIRRAESHALVSPIVAEVRAAEWQEALLRFLAEDLARCRDLEVSGGEFEQEFRVQLPLASGSLPLHGRFDRVLQTPQGEWIVDYKTSSVSSLKARSSLARALAGRDLQLVLYWIARRLDGHSIHQVEFAGIRPHVGARLPPPSFHPLKITDEAGTESSLRDMLTVLRDLLDRGHFPLVSDSSPSRSADRRCGRCPYRHACRHTHAPTVARNENLAVAQEYFARRDPRARAEEASA